MWTGEQRPRGGEEVRCSSTPGRASTGGHEIRVENEWFRERLYIDSQLADETRGLRLSTSLSGQIRGRDGTAREVRARLGQSLLWPRCRIWVGAERIASLKAQRNPAAVLLAVWAVGPLVAGGILVGYWVVVLLARLLIGPVPSP
jgi:hypothetical protein